MYKNGHFIYELAQEHLPIGLISLITLVDSFFIFWYNTLGFIGICKIHQALPRTCVS